MPIARRAPCQICCGTESKYTCAQCKLLYCSLQCYKDHKASSCRQQHHEANESAHILEPERTDLPAADSPPNAENAAQESAPAAPRPELRPLTSLRWPYVPEESAYPDPLKRDDPKTLQLHQYEAIATSPTIRRILASHPQLPQLLCSIDQLRGSDREEALERTLGVAPANSEQNHTEEDQRALRELAEAVEAAVRGGQQGILGLDWGD
ncbi:hypothetical protein WOLCODRAFT_28268 [Wolfiporia cocos MD-104 SS10]|uniref:HIT-type domain-containing protein n=1 Tax=Wolfiporia cocos (strain MD-104) TaxID=742152 RepID=A0A2H3J1D9_WOLCO|nr:hypothetical protein WOLCODRAFT_28268 [Wolfiporia cocos MD-104 SS10]